MRLVLIILAVIGALAVIGLLGMWLMHATMMGGNGMMDCRGLMGGGGWGGLLIIAVIVAAAVFLIGRKSRR